MASLADAEDVFRSTSAKTNFQRLTRLLMCGGLSLLRETFDSIHSPADLPLRLSDPTIKTQLKGARLSPPEWKCLYPSPGVYGNSTDFDITLTFRLLRTICNLTPPPGPRGWDDLPNSSDHSLEADLVRIKYYRNEVYGHSKTMEITDTEFNDLWGKISEALIRIAAGISPKKKDELKKSIDDFLVNPLTPEEERYTEELNTWCKQDMDVKSEVEKLKEEIKEGFAKQSQRLRHIEAILVVNTIESITKAGLPIMLNYPSGGPQIPHESDDSHGMCVIPVSDQERAEDDVSDSGDLQLNPLDTPTEIQIWTVILSFKKAFELFLQYLGYRLNVLVRNHDVGSLLITVECSSLQILEGLWKDYSSGHLNAITQEILVTEEVLEKLGLDDVRLKTFISEEEYENGKEIFMEISDPFEKRSDLQKEIIELRGRLEATEKASRDCISIVPNLQQENIELKERLRYMEVMSQVKEDNLLEKIIRLEKTLAGSRNDLQNEIIELRERLEAMEEASRDPFVRSPYLQKGIIMEKTSRDLQNEIIELRERLEAMEEASRGPFVRSSYLQKGIIMKKPSRGSFEQRSNLEEIIVLRERLGAMEKASRGKEDELEKKTVQLEERLDRLRVLTGYGPWQSEEDVQTTRRVMDLTPLHSGDPRPHYSQFDPFGTRASKIGPLSRRSSGKKGFCQVIVNRQELEALDTEKAEFKSTFKGLGYYVDEKVCGSNGVEREINVVANRDYNDYNCFVCFIQSGVTKDWEIEGTDGRSVSVTELVVKFSLEEMPKIFIIQGHQTTTAEKAVESLHDKPFSVKLPKGGNFLCLFVPYRKGYISTLLRVIKGSKRTRRHILQILSEAKKLFYDHNHITIPEPVHNLVGPVYLDLEV